MPATATAAEKAAATTPKRMYRPRAAAADPATTTAAITKSTAAAKSGRPRAKAAPAKTGTTEQSPSQARKAPPGRTSATQINFRADEETRQALGILTQDGTPISEAIRTAIRLAVWRMKEDQMVRDAEAAMADPADVAEMLQLRAELGSISAR